MLPAIMFSTARFYIRDLSPCYSDLYHSFIPLPHLKRHFMRLYEMYVCGIMGQKLAACPAMSQSPWRQGH